MLSEIEVIKVEQQANNYVGDRDVKATAARLLELNKEVKTALEEKEAAIRDKENAEAMVAEATEKLIESQNEVQELALRVGDLVEERDALLEELTEIKRCTVRVGKFCVKPPDIKEVFDRIQEDMLGRVLLDGLIFAIEETERQANN